MLDLHSEPYAPTGNLGDTGIRKLLGAPSLDLLQTLVRESVQNSCDAAKLDAGPEIRFHLRTLSRDEMETLVDEVLHEQPGETVVEAEDTFALPQSGDTPLRVLEIVDIGTTGLAGPVRADRIPRDTRYTDFIDFFRNIGTARNTDFGGGTYGFGKVALYLASRCSTILVDTLTESNEEPVRRFMGCRVGPAHDVVDPDGTVRRHTGRHWWGRWTDDRSMVEPLEGGEAASLVARLGMPMRSAAETGTTIMILDPRLDGMTVLEVGDRIVDQLLWQFWPRLTRDTPSHQRIRASVELEGVPLFMPEPELYPPLDHYAEALSIIRSGGGDPVTVRVTRKDVLAGTVATVRGMAADRADKDKKREYAHSIALMRPVGFVVRYLEGPVIPDERLEWAGVFVADSDRAVENAFAESEPPAHDDWQPGILPPGPDRTTVRGALRRIREVAESMVEQIAVSEMTATAGSDSVAAVATRLGSLLGSEGALRPARKVRKRSRGRPPTVARVNRPQFTRIGVEAGKPFAEFKVEVVTGAKSEVLDMAVHAVVDGGFERHLPNEENPLILSVLTADGESLERSGNVCQLRARLNTDLTVRTSLPEDMAVGIEARLRIGKDVL